ncbi:MAG: hypothetical protein Q7T70_02790 [Polaromonas sp.]|nr:hypothetical protein [Polaromonas sp.]
MSKNMADLRDMLFAQLKELNDASKPVDLSRHRVINEAARNIIETAKVEVMLAAVLKGSLEVPFIEAQTSERSSEPPTGESSPQERAQGVLDSGPAPDHPWRTSVVHRLKQ